jgi:hypothetical protein
MRCSRCSAEIADGSQFCVLCGAPAADRSTPTADPSGHGQGAAAPVSPAPAGASGGLAMAAGIVAILGVLVVIVACVVPYVRYTGIPGQSSYSILSYGKNSNGLWFAAEPVGVALLGLAAAVLVMASGRVPGLRWLAAGMLLAFGVQTIALFAGYQFGFISNSSAHTGNAGYIGIVAGLILAAAGVLAAVAGAIGRSGTVSAPAVAAPGGWTGTAR